MKLDSKTVAGLTLPAGKTDVIVFDSALTGFGLRLRQATDGELKRQWIVQYRHAGHQRRMLLGSAEVLGVEQARGAAKKALGAVALGQDPQGEKTDRRDRDRFTFAGVAADYLVAKKSTVRPRTFVELERYLTGAYFKPLHSLPLDRIARKDIAACLTVIDRESGRTAAVRARSHLSGLFAWAMAQGLIEANPVNGTGDLKEPPPRDRVLSNAELAAVWSAAGDINLGEFGKVVRLLILTGARRSEVGGMRWPELAYGVWTLPKERSKNGREPSLPLPPAAMAIIETIPHRNDREHLFGNASNVGFSMWDFAKNMLDKRLGDKVKPFTLHDLRRTTATGMANLGILPHVIEMVLNHQSGHKGGIGGVYNRSSYEREVRAALVAWAAHVTALVAL